ncbi:hypothetical protein MAR_019012 [Mya arenaria]|uniref:Uncharacterized protein n=1 Tax=Mya arenaria TaxID=6604 RepID=A0ABY7EJ56_MYAAR|nr:hypothetical protein MAR_019012 [Mya arenaria]
MISPKNDQNSRGQSKHTGLYLELAVFREITCTYSVDSQCESKAKTFRQRLEEYDFVENKAIADLIMPGISIDDVDSYIWRHIEVDMEVIKTVLATGDNLDDIFTMMHVVIDRLGDYEQGLEWACHYNFRRKEGRKLWEEKFTKTVLQPVIEKMTEAIAGKNKMLAEDTRLAKAAGDETERLIASFTCAWQIVREQLKTYVCVTEFGTAKESLHSKVKDVIYEESNNLPEVCRSIDVLDIAIRFLRSTGGEPDMHLFSYLKEKLQMTTELCSQKEVFDALDKQFHDDLPDESLSSLHGIINSLTEKELANFVDKLHEFIIMKLTVNEKTNGSEYSGDSSKQKRFRCAVFTRFRVEKPRSQSAVDVGSSRPTAANIRRLGIASFSGPATFSISRIVDVFWSTKS